MGLVRVTNENGLFEKLREQWQNQCQRFGEDLADYAAPHLDHAARICAENPPDPRYGIYAVQSGNEFECLMHVNQARLPGTNGWTLRVLWILLAPRFDFEEIDASGFATIATSIIEGAIEIANSEPNSAHIKIHLSNMGDRRFFIGVAYALRGHAAFELIETRANWLHMSLKSLS